MMLTARLLYWVRNEAAARGYRGERRLIVNAHHGKTHESRMQANLHSSDIACDYSVIAFIVIFFIQSVPISANEVIIVSTLVFHIIAFG